MKGGVECILGIHRDPVFGPIAMFGLGGIFVEVMKDVVFRRCPFGDDVAEQMTVRSRRALLLGARGRKPADIPALAHMLSRLSAFSPPPGRPAPVGGRPQPCFRNARRKKAPMLQMPGDRAGSRIMKAAPQISD